MRKFKLQILSTLVIVLLFTATASAANLTILPINLSGDTPGPFEEVYKGTLWEALYYRLIAIRGMDITGYNRVQEVMKDKEVTVEDFTKKIPFVRINESLEDNAIVAIHMTVKAPGETKKKSKQKPYILALNVIMYNAGSGYLINVLKTTIKHKQLPGVIEIAKLIEAKILKEGKIEKKYKDEDKAAETPESFAKFYLKYAEKSDKPKQAQKCYKKALLTCPKDKNTWIKYINFMKKHKAKDSISRAFEEVEKLFPEDTDLLVFHAETAKAVGLKDEVEAALEKALELDPKNFRALMFKASLLYEKKKYEEAKKIYQQLADGAQIDLEKEEMERYVKKCEDKIAEKKK